MLSRILNWAATEKGIIAAAPKIWLSKAEGRKLRIAPEIVTALLNKMDRDCSDAFQIALETGMRKMEILSMRWEDIDFANNLYFNPRGKSERARRPLPISDVLFDLLEARPSVAQSEWVFPSRSSAITPATIAKAREMFGNGASIRAVNKGLGISWPTAKQIKEGKKIAVEPRTGHRVTIDKQFDAARKAAGVKGIVLHSGRHEFASSFAQYSQNLGALQAIMGHESIATTNKYVHATIDGAREVINERNRPKLKIVKRA